MRARGLKFLVGSDLGELYVVPHAGTWIEMIWARATS